MTFPKSREGKDGGAFSETSTLKQREHVIRTWGDMGRHGAVVASRDTYLCRKESIEALKVLYEERSQSDKDEHEKKRVLQ